MQNPKQNTQQEQPFFVRFLEKQQTMSVKTDVKAGWGGGRTYETMKYPSDDPAEEQIAF